MLLAKSTSPAQEVTEIQPGTARGAGKSKKGTLTGHGEAIPLPTPTTVDLLPPNGGSPHHTATGGTKQRSVAESNSGKVSDRSDLPTDITDNISTN